MQDKANHIAALFHDAGAKAALARRAAKEADLAHKALHAALDGVMPAMSAKLGIDAQPLSGGGAKPPRNPA